MGADTVCVELSSSRCEILKAKGFNNVICEDFVMWAQKTDQKFDRIVMNPPFADGRALQHVRLALTLLKTEGKLTAVVPANFDVSKLEGAECIDSSGNFKGAFVGTGVVVKIISLKLSK
jgi:16S rRNA G1207 methylase RsmC